MTGQSLDIVNRKTMRLSGRCVFGSTSQAWFLNIMPSILALVSLRQGSSHHILVLRCLLTPGPEVPVRFQVCTNGDFFSPVTLSCSTFGEWKLAHRLDVPSSFVSMTESVPHLALSHLHLPAPSPSSIKPEMCLRALSAQCIAVAIIIFILLLLQKQEVDLLRKHERFWFCRN